MSDKLLKMDRLKRDCFACGNRADSTEFMRDPDSCYCNSCYDKCSMCGHGEDAYPWYGGAPHKHEGIGNGWKTVYDPKDQWPANFEEDVDNPEETSLVGTYHWCPQCGFPSSFEPKCKNGRIVTTENEVS